MRALLAAEILKLRRRRALMIWSLLLTLGVTVIISIVLIALHAANPAHHGPAGGVDGFEGYTGLLGLLGSVVAIIIGSTAGTQDVSNGVFRDLVVTGRKRSTLFNVRAPGAFIVLVAMLLPAFLLSLVLAFGFAGSKPTPSGGEIGHVALYLLFVTAINLVISIGLAAFLSSRIVVGVAIAWSIPVSHILINIRALGGARKLVSTAAAEQFAPRHMIDNHLSMSDATALAVLVVWTVLFLAAGRYWTDRRDA